MLQDRLNGLAMCCIEKDVLDNIDLDIVLNDFASRKMPQDIFSASPEALFSYLR